MTTQYIEETYKDHNYRERYFEAVRSYEGKLYSLPLRSTKNSAGYDFYAVDEITIPPFCPKSSLDTGIVLVPTGVKAKFPPDEVLLLFNRSSNPMKKGLILLNGVGVVDSDYYSNPDNDGHILFQFCNVSISPFVFKRGDKIGQGIFIPYLKISNDFSPRESRTGGFGSSQ